MKSTHKDEGELVEPDSDAGSSRNARETTSKPVKGTGKRNDIRCSADSPALREERHTTQSRGSGRNPGEGNSGAKAGTVAGRRDPGKGNIGVKAGTVAGRRDPGKGNIGVKAGASAGGRDPEDLAAGSYRRGFCAEHEARHLLARQGWYVTRCRGQDFGPDLIAARKGEVLLIVVRHCRQPVSSAAEVASRYAADLRRLRRVECPSWVRKEAWIQAPPDGWRFYEVFPAGIRRVVRDNEGIALPVPGGDEVFG